MSVIFFGVRVTFASYLTAAPSSSLTTMPSVGLPSLRKVNLVGTSGATPFVSLLAFKVGFSARLIASAAETLVVSDTVSSTTGLTSGGCPNTFRIAFASSAGWEIYGACVQSGYISRSLLGIFSCMTSAWRGGVTASASPQRIEAGVVTFVKSSFLSDSSIFAKVSFMFCGALA